LLDATAKKAAFLHHLKHELGLHNVEIVVGRAEEVAHLGEYRERFDIVLSMEVLHHCKRPWRLVPELARICKPGGAA